MAPIVIKEFEWRENSDWVFIVVNVKGVRTGSTDIVSSPTFLKLHYAPFIFEVFLNNEVEDGRSECRIDEKAEQVSFRMKKATPGLIWGELEDTKLSKEEKQRRREEAVKITQERSEQDKSEKQKRQFDRKQVTVHDQIKLDADAKDRISRVKAEEGQEALKSFGLGKEGVEGCGPGENELCNNDKNNLVNVGGDGDKKSCQIFDLPNQSAVGIRPSVCISVNFTPREFPTPSRESKHVEEQEWLKKQAEARRLCGFVDEDLRPEERNPQWLLDKGLSLMKAESFLGAVSAFSLGIKLASKMPELFVERAGAHLALKNYNRTVEDASQALELLTPKVKGNEEDRLKCHVRRGNAFKELEMWEDAAVDYEHAISLKNSEEVSQVRDEIRSKLEERAKEGTGS